jgi:hypothetical protein
MAREINESHRFDTIASLYLLDTGYLRPGKSAPQSSHEDPMSDENQQRFRKWMMNEAFESAICRVAELEEQVEELERELD